VLVGKQENAEPLADAYTAIKEDDPDFYGVALESRAAADAVALAPVLVTDAANPDDRGRILVVQSSDADWKTTGIPAAYSAIAGNVRTAVVYHDTDTVPAEWAWLVNRLAYNPDQVSVPWNTWVRGVTAYASAITATEKQFLRDNFANPMLPNGTEPFWFDPGTTLEGREVSAVLTADWFTIRLKEAVAARQNQLHGAGLKLPVNPTGQATILGEIKTLFRQGGRGQSPHFQGTPVVRALPITASDIAARLLRFEGSAQLTSAARKFQLRFTFSEQPLTL
jgi:hypothetical protein